jgi:hypothetical protein
MDDTSAVPSSALRPATAALALAIALSLTLPAPAREIFKSYDAQGHVVYSDQRDPAAQETVISDDAVAIPEAGTVLDAPMEATAPGAARTTARAAEPSARTLPTPAPARSVLPSRPATAAQSASPHPSP